MGIDTKFPVFKRFLRDAQMGIDNYAIYGKMTCLAFTEMMSKLPYFSGGIGIHTVYSWFYKVFFET